MAIRQVSMVGAQSVKGTTFDPDLAKRRRDASSIPGEV